MRRMRTRPALRELEQPAGIHLHLHGVSTEDTAAMLAGRETEADHE